jgi:hypothetical protein
MGTNRASFVDRGDGCTATAISTLRPRQGDTGL